MTKISMTVPRRDFLLGTGALALGAAGGVFNITSALAQAMPEIPAATVRLAANPYGNHAWVVLAARKGYLKDVGITLEPAEPKIVLEQQSVPQLENGEIDVSTMYLGMVTEAIDKTPNIKPFFIHSYWAGNTIVVAPDSGIKSVDEFIAEGLAWPEASAATMKQLQGKDIVVPPNPSTYPWMNLAYSFAGLKMEDSNVIALEDPKAVQLAISGGVKIAAPGGAVQIYQLQQQAGWKTIMSTGQMVKFIGADSGPINNVLNYDCLITTQEYIDKNRDTVLRLCSALYRTVDYMFGPEQTTALTEYAPFINANAGSDLDAAAIKFIFEVLDPFYGWKEQKSIWEDPTYPLYYRNIYESQLAAYKKEGKIADQDYDLEQFFQAKQLWQEMSGQQKTADELLAKIAAAGTLAADKQALVDAGKKHYDGYNFLDAVRFLKAATA